MSYHNEDVQDLSDKVRHFTTSIELVGTPQKQIHEEADAIINSVKKLARKHGGPRE
jgi:hypothetical protein